MPISATLPGNHVTTGATRQGKGNITRQRVDTGGHKVDIDGWRLSAAHYNKATQMKVCSGCGHSDAVTRDAVTRQAAGIRNNTTETC